MKYSLSTAFLSTALLLWSSPGSVASPIAERGIVTIEDRAEAMAEGEVRGAQAGVASAQIVADWVPSRALLAARAPSGALRLVDSAIEKLHATARSGRDVRRAANELTGALAGLFVLNGDQVPAAIHTLDYLQRSIALDAAAGEWNRADRDMQTMSSVWRTARPDVRTRKGGLSAAASLQRSLERMRLAIQAHKSHPTIAASAQASESVDLVERTFTR